MQLKLFYTAPAPMGREGARTQVGDEWDAGWEKWSLPLGNGYFGASVFGRISEERIQITEPSVVNPFLKRGSSEGGDGGTRTTGDIYLDFPHVSASDYERSLDISEAISYVSYKNEGWRSDAVTYERECFLSYPDRVFVMRLTASEKKSLSFRVRLSIPFLRDFCETEGDGCGRSGEVFSLGDRLVMRGVSHYYNIISEGQARVLTVGGSVSYNDDGITVDAADEAVLLFTVATNYRLEARVFEERDPKKKLLGYPDPHKDVSERLDRAVTMGYDLLRRRHIEDYQSLFSRVSLSFPYDTGDTLIPTDALLSAYKKGRKSRYLEMLYYQYGRYLLISSSRSGGLPANLQGIWTAYDSSPWGCDYHHNINLQMNYWPSFVAGLPECFIPYADYARAYMPYARHLADVYVRTHCGEHFSRDGENGWLIGTFAIPYEINSFDKTAGPGAVGLTALLFWEYYAFTGDKAFLADVAYPLLYEASRFMLKTLYPYGDKYLVRESVSPEQLHEGKHYEAPGCAFDQQMVYEGFLATLRAAEELGYRGDAVLTEIGEKISLLDHVLIGESGQVKEFREENRYGDIGEYRHRHISQLVSLYPGCSINKSTPDWLRGARISLENRSDESTGWATAHRLCAWARLGDGDRAYRLFGTMLGKNTLPNLWDTHPPFQIDGNFGATAGVSEMLLQSHGGCIDFLPSLPSEWAEGNFAGLCARGGFVCGCEWKDGSCRMLSVRASRDGAVRIRAPRIAKMYHSHTVKPISEDEIETLLLAGEIFESKAL